MYEKGWNQSELSRKSEIGRDSISTYVNGKSVPTPRNLEKLALALGTEPEKLYPNYDEANNKQSDKVESFNKIDDGSGQYWVYVNRKLEGKVAIKIMQLLNEIDD
jgi:transcriptional regulator with XRE-family HTH domain